MPAVDPLLVQGDKDDTDVVAATTVVCFLHKLICCPCHVLVVRERKESVSMSDADSPRTNKEAYSV